MARALTLFVMLLAAAFLVRMGMVLVPLSGELEALSPKLVDQCQRVDVAPGTEDVAIDVVTSRAYVSTSDRRAWSGDAGASTARNGVYAIDLTNPTEPRKVSPSDMEDFAPHGISFWRSADEDEPPRLFVVNHATTGRESVEIFRVETNGMLTHLESVAFPEMFSPNDVVAVGNRRFYATNDRRYDGGVLGQLEALLGLPLVNVVYFDGSAGRVVIPRLTYANGVNRSADARAIYVSEFLTRKVHVYDRDRATGDLILYRSHPVKTGPDNIDVAPNGALYVAGHSRVFDFLEHADNPAAIAPSHVIRLDPETGETEDVFIATEGEINGSSVGAATDYTLIVGAVFDGHVMVCPLTQS